MKYVKSVKVQQIIPMDMNPSQLLRIAEVSALTTLAKSTINLWVAQGKFPKPMSLSPTIKCWRMGDIDEWINSKFEGK